MLTTFKDDHANFPHWIIQKLTSLEYLLVESSSFKEIFSEVIAADEKGRSEMRPRIKRLLLSQLDKLPHICKEGFQVDPTLEHLEALQVMHCFNLICLVPSSVNFCQLAYLEVHNCFSLIYLVTSSTARSLVKLKTLIIKDCDSLTQVVSKERDEDEDELTFRSLIKIELQCLPMVKCFCSAKCSVNFPFLETVVVKQCPRMNVFTLGSTSTPKLRKIVSKEDDQKLYLDGSLNKTLSKMFMNTVEHLELSQYPELKEVWHNHGFQQHVGVFGNLKVLVVKDCDFLLGALLPLYLLQGLPNLEEVEVSDCDSLEGVFSLINMTEKENIQLKKITLTRLPSLKHIWKLSNHEIESFDDSQILKISKTQGTRETTTNDTADPQLQLQASSIGQVLLPKLETLILDDMENLETIWHPIIISNSMRSFETLKVKKCPKIELIFRIHMNGAFAILKTLEIEDCSSVQEIFQLDVNDICNEDHTSQLKNLSLQVVHVKNCDDLEYLFPLSIAKNLPQLETITIKNAEKMKEIVSSGDEPLDNHVQFVFDQLTSMVIWNLQGLQGFYAGNHNLSCSMMKILDVRNCNKLKLFKTQGTCISQGRLSDGSDLQLSMRQPLFTLEEVMDNLEQLSLSSEHLRIISQGDIFAEHFRKLKLLILQNFEDDQTIFPYWFLKNMPALECHVVEWSSFEVIFPNEVPVHPEGKIENTTRIKQLKLNGLQELLHICKEGCQIDPILEFLEYLDVNKCSKLKNLAPSSVTFNHLTYLVVQNCMGLIYLITSSTARSLKKLTTLKIGKCDSIVEIVVQGKGEDNINEITFNSLEVLELDSLSKLQMFCSSECSLKLPLFKEFVIRQCPRMTCFSSGETSAPMLQLIRKDEGDGKWCWKDDLAKTVNKMFHDMEAFSNSNYLELSEYPELKEVWYSPIGEKIFCNLKHLVVCKCTFLSNMLISSTLLQVLCSLEELEVAECDSLQAIFDVKALDDKTVESKKVSGLKKLKLSKLPNLKHIWNREVEKIISFGNLQIIDVDHCQNLKYVFSVSLCQDLRQLEELNIESCGVEEIVSFEEGLEEIKFDFPRLTSLKLLNLSQLTSFYPKRYTLECASLKILNVGECEEIQIFSFDDFNPRTPADIDLQKKQSLFHIEKVPQNLEELSLNENDTMRILNGKIDQNLFQNVNMLSLQQFHESPMKLLNVLIQIFPETTILQACCSSFKWLFSSKAINHRTVECISQIKALWLFQLEQLEHIWIDDDSVSHPLAQTVEYLIIDKCSRLIRLAPRCATFKNLTSLGVENCSGLMYFMTSYTAKSLVNLTSLTISNCGMLEDVVMMDEGDEGESEEVITFERLNDLQLTGLSALKSFCCGKHTFIFPSLVTLKVTGCHKMQRFSYGVIIAPFLKVVEVENGRRRWREDLNTTINQLFIEKATEEEVEGDVYKTSSSSQMHQKIESTSRDISSEELGPKSKADDIDQGKQEMHKLPSPHAAVYSSPSQASEAVMSSIQDEDKLQDSNVHLDENLLTQATTFMAAEDIETQETNESNKTSVHDAQNVLSPAMVDDTAIYSAPLQASSSSTTPVTDFSSSFKELNNVLIPHTGVHSQNISEIVETPLDLARQNTSNFTKVDADTGSGAKENHGTIQRQLFQISEDMLNSTSVQGSDEDTATWTHVTQSTLDNAIEQKKEESNDYDIQLSKNLFDQTIAYVAEDNEEMRNETTHKPSIQATQEAHNYAISQNIEESHDSKTHLGKNFLNQPRSFTIDGNKPKTQEIHNTIQTDQVIESLATTRSTETLHESLFGTQEKSDTIKKSSSPTTQHVQNHAINPDDAVRIDPSPSFAQEPMAPPTQESNAYKDFKLLIDISKQNLPHLEAGVKRHPQVLEWFNTKLALFTEVTRILRTNRRRDLTEDNRNHIKECCAALEAVGFDACWLSYVHGCIESSEDEEELKRKLEETEAKAFTLRNELASVEASLASLRDRVSRLDAFIES